MTQIFNRRPNNISLSKIAASLFATAVLSISTVDSSIAKQEITDNASKTQDSADVHSYYHRFHQHPELGKEEHETAEFIRKKLTEFGYTDLQTVAAAPTTVIAILDTKKSGPTICFRSEMDARKCLEKTDLAFASRVPGVMHNCGHDAHAAILLETAKRLMQIKSELKGKIVFLFQPAEECAGGADEIVKDGILKRLGIEAIFAQHCANREAVGLHLLSPGPVLAGSNNLSVEITGVGGHAAQPANRDDLAGLASLITLELERLPGRIVDPIYYPTVCAITTSTWSSTQSNVAPESITLGGTVRAFYGMDDKLFRGKSFREHVTQLVDGLSSAYGAKAKCEITLAAPVTVNDPKLSKKVKETLEKSGLKIDDEEKGMYAEDFSYYTAEFPSAYFGLGIAKDHLGMDNPHSSHFTIHEDCLESGIELFVQLAKSYSETP